jgi:hypothetical protein
VLWKRDEMSEERGVEVAGWEEAAQPGRNVLGVFL